MWIFVLLDPCSTVGVRCVPVRRGGLGVLPRVAHLGAGNQDHQDAILKPVRAARLRIPVGKLPRRRIVGETVTFLILHRMVMMGGGAAEYLFRKSPPGSLHDRIFKKMFDTQEKVQQYYYLPVLCIKILLWCIVGRQHDLRRESRHEHISGEGPGRRRNQVHVVVCA